jgi:hypothetical protein
VEYAKPTRAEIVAVRELYEQRYRPGDIADRLEPPDRVVGAAIQILRSKKYKQDEKAQGKQARKGLFIRRQAEGSGS